MNLPIGKISGQKLEDLCKKAIDHHKDIFYKTIEQYEPVKLYNDWKNLVLAIDEIINIPFELKDQNQIDNFLNLNPNFLDKKNIENLKEIVAILNKEFDDEVGQRFQDLSVMSSAIYESYKINGISTDFNMKLNDISDTITFFQSRRRYYITVLALIPKISHGIKKIDFIQILNSLQYTLDSCILAITTSYYNLLLNESLSDFELNSDGKKAKGNFDYSHLEGFFLEPERLSLIDQMELRPDIIVKKNLFPKPENKIFSFTEVTNTMSLYEGAFNKYKIHDNQVFKDLNLFFDYVSKFLINDYEIIVNENEFINISKKYPRMKLFNSDLDYFTELNSFCPFQKSVNEYYSTVVLLTRFAAHSLSLSLQKNRAFQINSGFVFEDKVLQLLEKFGLKSSGITRINHKEFDLITIKNNKVYNFQCKNNIIDISKVNNNYKIIGRLNRQLCSYYEKALLKEQNRENLIKTKTGINHIDHFVISRYPVITRNKKIINYRNLEKWLEINHG